METGSTRMDVSQNKTGFMTNQIDSNRQRYLSLSKIDMPGFTPMAYTDNFKSILSEWTRVAFTARRRTVNMAAVQNTLNRCQIPEDLRHAKQEQK